MQLTTPKAELERFIEWQYIYGATYSFLIKAVDPDSKEVIPALEKMPNLSYVESYYLRCFNNLESSRQMGMGVGKIPLSEILLYKNELGEDLEFVEIMQHCDNAYLKVYYNDPKNKPK